MALASSPHRIGKHVHFDRAQRAVGLRHGGRPDEGSVADVAELALFRHGDADVVRKLQLDRLAAA